MKLELKITENRWPSYLQKGEKVEDHVWHGQKEQQTQLKRELLER